MPLSATALASFTSTLVTARIAASVASPITTSASASAASPRSCGWVQASTTLYSAPNVATLTVHGLYKARQLRGRLEWAPPDDETSFSVCH